MAKENRWSFHSKTADLQLLIEENFPLCGQHIRVTCLYTAHNKHTVNETSGSLFLILIDPLDRDSLLLCYRFKNLMSIARHAADL